MGLPEEDRGPAWLRDYGRGSGYTKSDAMTGYDEGALAVDLASLVDFADALENEHTLDYRPHVDVVFKDMSAKPADPQANFVELVQSMSWQRELLVQTSDALVKHDKAVQAFVAAARDISKQYGEADALSSARAQDVNRTLAPTLPAQTVVAPDGTTGGTPGAPSSTIPVVTPTDTSGNPVDTGGGDY